MFLIASWPAAAAAGEREAEEEVDEEAVEPNLIPSNCFVVDFGGGIPFPSPGIIYLPEEKWIFELLIAIPLLVDGFNIPEEEAGLTWKMNYSSAVFHLCGRWVLR